MKRRAHRIWVWLAMIGSGATLFQTTTTTTFPFTGTGGGGYFGCQRFATNSVGQAIDWCYLLDCENGFFGGLVDPCNDVSSGQAWLLDCPNATQDTTDGTTDGTTNDTTTNNTTTG